MSAWPSLSKSEKLTDHQQQAVPDATARQVGILTGGPGVGKTFCLAALAKEIVCQHGLDSLAIACPTGKAATRITEVMLSHGVISLATTIHRLLGVQSVVGSDGWSFRHNDNNPLGVRFLLIDEASMVSTSLAASLLRACHNATNILWTGDPDQLPPVGHGAPLRDMIAAGVPCGDLREIRRNSGSIVEACADIRDGKPFHTDDRLDFESGKNLKLIATLTPAGNVAAILGTLRSIRRARRLDPVWDCQVLAAVNERSPVSRRDLNRRLREEFNPNGQAIKGCPFRVGDKIICLKNSMMPCEDAEDDATCDDRGRIYVANGELARVMKIFPKYFIATLESPRRVVRVPVGGNGDGNSCQFDLGYAITAHKSQGSEWPVVIVALDDSRGAGFVTNREWFYTAISRAKRACILVGKRATADAMCRRTAIDKRKTFLQELIECQTRM